MPSKGARWKLRRTSTHFYLEEQLLVEHSKTKTKHSPYTRRGTPLQNTYFSRAWASEGTVDPFPLAYIFILDLSRTCQTTKAESTRATMATWSYLSNSNLSYALLLIWQWAEEQDDYQTAQVSGRGEKEDERKKNTLTPLATSKRLGHGLAVLSIHHTPQSSVSAGRGYSHDIPVPSLWTETFPSLFLKDPFTMHIRPFYYLDHWNILAL